MLGPPITGAGELWAANCMQHMELLLALHQFGPWSLLDMIGEFGWHVLKNILKNKKNYSAFTKKYYSKILNKSTGTIEKNSPKYHAVRTFLRYYWR